MKRNYVYFLFTCLLTFVVSGCDTDIEPEVIQAANTYNEEYYQNLREYKKTDHAICFGWYAGYTSEASPSQGLHFTGLPDSLDIVSLWSGIPSNNPAYVETSYYNERYLPTAYEEMNYIRTVKGTRQTIIVESEAKRDQLKTSWKEVMGYGEENPANAWTIQ